MARYAGSCSTSAARSNPSPPPKAASTPGSISTTTCAPTSRRTRTPSSPGSAQYPAQSPSPRPVPATQRIPLPPATPVHAPDDETAAVELDLVISPAGRIVLPGNNHPKSPAALGGQHVTIWADLRSIHLTLAGEFIRSRHSGLTKHDFEHLRLRGGAARPEPAHSAAPRTPIQAPDAVELERTVGRNGDVGLTGARHQLGADLAGQRVILRIDQHMPHVISDGQLVKTLPAPVTPHQAAKLNDAHIAAGPLPPARQGAVEIKRTIPADGITQVAGQRLRVGRAHAGKHVVIVAEDTVFRVLHNDIEIRRSLACPTRRSRTCEHPPTRRQVRN